MSKTKYIRLAVLVLTLAFGQYTFIGYTVNRAEGRAFAEGCKFGKMAVSQQLQIQFPKEIYERFFANCDEMVKEYLGSSKRIMSDMQSELSSEP